MLTEFMRDWYKESLRWIDSMMKTVVSESPENAQQIQVWIEKWQPRVIEALSPLAEASVGIEALNEVSQQFAMRLKRIGLTQEGAAA